MALIRRALAILIPLSLLFALAASAQGATLKKLGEFDEPIFVTSSPTEASRLLIVERPGLVMQMQGGKVTTYVDISSLVTTAEGDRGLWSIAVPPDFPTTGRIFVDYSGKEEPGEIHIAEVRPGPAAPTVRNLLTIPHAEANHYGGQLQFGPEGMLFISTGDGSPAAGGDPHHNAQNLTTALGKILRIDPEPSGAAAFTIPAGNPFAASPNPTTQLIWSYGLRNPFRFSFDRVTGALVIGDVGQNTQEEVDYAPAPGLGAGADYGWNCREGTIPGPATDPECATPPAGGYTEPLFTYPHTAFPHHCGIIGGYVVRDQRLRGLYGRYVYGDICSGEIFSFAPTRAAASNCSEGLIVGGIVSFGEDAAARVYAASDEGGVYRLEPSGHEPCGLVPPRPSRLRLTAARRTVPRGERALLSAHVAPCAGRAGERVVLVRGQTTVESRKLNGKCSARFRPRITRAGGYRATISADATSVGATSSVLRLRPAPGS